jgi:hypothetical protein
VGEEGGRKGGLFVRKMRSKRVLRSIRESGAS